MPPPTGAVEPLKRADRTAFIHCLRAIALAGAFELACDGSSNAPSSPPTQQTNVVAVPATPQPAASAATTSLPRPSASAHFEYVPGTEKWSMARMRGDANYRSSYTYQTCMKAPPHRADEAAVCKDINDSCVDNWRSQEACDKDSKSVGIAGLSNVKKLDDPNDPTGASFFADPNAARETK
jgi:hypothetical protein